MTSQKGVIVATILAALITASVSLFIYFDDKTKGLNVVETVNSEINKKNAKEHTPKPRIVFQEVFVTPINTKISSFFYAEIKNEGDKEANNFFISVEFGETRPKKCEINSIAIASENLNNNPSIQQWKIQNLNIKQSVYITCLTNSPFFKHIAVNGGNLENNKQLSFLSYKEQRENESTSFYEKLLKFILGSLTGITLFYIFLRLMRSLG